MMQRRFKWFWILCLPPLALACAQTTAPQPEPEVVQTCTNGVCMTCMIYETSVECVKE